MTKKWLQNTQNSKFYGIHSVLTSNEEGRKMYLTPIAQYNNPLLFHKHPQGQVFGERVLSCIGFPWGGLAHRPEWCSIPQCSQIKLWGYFDPYNHKLYIIYSYKTSHGLHLCMYTRIHPKLTCLTTTKY